MRKEKAYFDDIKKTIQPFKEVVYFEPLNENEILQLEEEWGLKLKPILREFLLNFGFTQDVIKKLRMDREDMKENLDWLRENELFNFVPIKTKITANRDLIIALNNDEIEDEYLYEIDLEAKDESRRIKRKKKKFTEIINKEVSKINVVNRCKNRNKIRVSEFIIETTNIQDLLVALKDIKIRQLSEWVDKYYPENPFGSKIAKFEMFAKIRLVFEKNERSTEYRFEIEEPILLDKKESLIQKTEKLLAKSKLEFENIECDLIETE